MRLSIFDVSPLGLVLSSCCNKDDAASDSGSLGPAATATDSLRPNSRRQHVSSPVRGRGARSSESSRPATAVSNHAAMDVVESKASTESKQDSGHQKLSPEFLQTCSLHRAVIPLQLSSLPEKLRYVVRGLSGSSYDDMRPMFASQCEKASVSIEARLHCSSASIVYKVRLDEQDWVVKLIKLTDGEGQVEVLHHKSMDLGKKISELDKGDGRRPVGSFVHRLGLALNAAKALAELHCAGIVHRDVKEGNFLVDDRANVFIADMMDTGRHELKLMSAPSLLREQSDAAMTIPYADPLFCRHEKTGFPVDVYSFGMVLCFMFDAGTLKKRISRGFSSLFFKEASSCQALSSQTDLTVNPVKGFLQTLQTVWGNSIDSDMIEELFDLIKSTLIYDKVKQTSEGRLNMNEVVIRLQALQETLEAQPQCQRANARLPFKS